MEVFDQDKPKRKVKGIWIPIEIWECKILTLQQKVFLAEIDSLDHGNGCYAKNKWFSKQFGISQDRASRVIGSLIDLGLVSSKLIYKTNSKEVEKRLLKMIAPLPVEIPIGPGESTDTPPGRNTEDIIYKIDNIDYRKDIGNVPAEQLPNDSEKETSKTNLNKTLQRKATKVLSRLNQLGSKPRGFRPVPENLKYIISRLKDGFSVQDCFYVLETKVHDPYFQEHPNYFNPETLFRPKNFEKYLNEKIQDYEKKQPGVANGSGVSGNIDYSLRPGRDKKIKVDKTNWEKYEI